MWIHVNIFKINKHTHPPTGTNKHLRNNRAKGEKKCGYFNKIGTILNFREVRDI